MTFSVLIPHGSRPVIRDSLIGNTDFFSELNAEIVIGSTHWDGHLSAGVLGALPVKIIERVCPSGGPFNKAEAINAAFGASTGDNILLIDADIILDKEVASRIREVSFDASYYVLSGICETEYSKSSRFLRSRAARINLETNDGRRAEVVKSKYNLETGRFLGTGLISLSRHAFCRVGGFNEELCGWGWEDVDFQIRLQMAGFNSSEVEVRGWHLTHGDDQRAVGSGGKAGSEAENARRAFERYETGDFLGTLQSHQTQRDLVWRPK